MHLSTLSPFHLSNPLPLPLALSIHPSILLVYSPPITVLSYPPIIPRPLLSYIPLLSYTPYNLSYVYLSPTYASIHIYHLSIHHFIGKHNATIKGTLDVNLGGGTCTCMTGFSPGYIHTHTHGHTLNNNIIHAHSQGREGH